MRRGFGADTPDGSALDQIAQQLLRATALLGILLVGDGAGLAAQFDAQEGVLQGFQVRIHFLRYLLDWRSADGSR